MEIIYNKKSLKYLKTLDKKTRQRIRKAIKGVPLGDIIKLHGMQNEYRLRIGNFRVLFIQESDIISVQAIGSRGQIYRRI